MTTATVALKMTVIGNYDKDDDYEGEGGGGGGHC